MSFGLFIFGIIIIIACVVAAIALRSWLPAIGAVIVTILTICFTCLYTQDVGEVVVIRNLGGELAGYTETAGFHWKAPWQDTIDYDIRNNIINLYRDTAYTYDNGKATGMEVTVYDKSGAQANVDVQVIYSLDPDAAIDLYTKYQAQENFVQIAAVNNVRDAARNASGQFSTIQMLTEREKYAEAIHTKLEASWNGIGLRVEEVNVQDIRYSQNIIDAYNNAQKTEISKVEVQNEQEAQRVRMDTEVMIAEKEAKANKIRSESLTPEILQQQYIDALRSIGNGQGNVIVVPEGTIPVITTSATTE